MVTRTYEVHPINDEWAVYESDGKGLTLIGRFADQGDADFAAWAFTGKAKGWLIPGNLSPATLARLDHG